MRKKFLQMSLILILAVFAGNTSAQNLVQHLESNNIKIKEKPIKPIELLDNSDAKKSDIESLQNSIKITENEIEKLRLEKEHLLHEIITLLEPKNQRGIGDDCSNPYIVDVEELPYTFNDVQKNGTCGHGNNYDFDFLGAYDNGEDVVYKVKTPKEAEIIVTLDGEETSFGYWHSIAIYDAEPTADKAPLQYMQSKNNINPVHINHMLEANKDYFVVVDFFGSDTEPCLPSYTIDMEFSDEAHEFYDLYIAREQVTYKNADDLSVINGVTGSVSYDNETKTLTLEDATIRNTDKAGIESNIKDLKINIIGEDTIDVDIVCISGTQSLSIIGDGSLYAKASGNVSILFQESELTIKDCEVEAIGSDWGIAGKNLPNEKLIIDNATVKAQGTTYGSIRDIATLTLNKCAITKPIGAEFTTVGDTTGVFLNDIVVREQVVIAPTVSATNDISVKANFAIYPTIVENGFTVELNQKSANDLTVEIYNLLGVKMISQKVNSNRTYINVADLAEGVYIVKINDQTSKILKK